MRPKKLLFWVFLIFFSCCASAANAQSDRKTLDIYVIDVEGGNSVLFVAPSGESVLIDTGNVAPGAIRDAERIMAAARDARITQIDHLIITHWHGDHFGGLAELASRIPIKQFIDHGANAQPTPQTNEFLDKTYPELYARSTHMIAKPGDKISVTGLDWRVVTSAGMVLRSPLPGAGKINPFCANFKPSENNAEDPQSVGSYITFGKFRTAHLGDLTKNKEFELMCPRNLLGTVDLLLGLHHGQASSNSEVLVHALHPRVAIMNNGTRKGGEPEVMRTVYSSSGLEDLWQMHFSFLSGQEYTVPGMFIANTIDDQPPDMPIAPMPAPIPSSAPPAPQHNGQAYWIKVSAQLDGSFTVTNTRNGFAKSYVPRSRR